MKILKTIWQFIRFIVAEIWLLSIYMIMRVLKIPFFDSTIDPYGSWLAFDDQISRDTTIVVWLVLGTTGFIFLSWWWFLICLALLILNLIVFFIWIWRKSRKDGNNMGNTIAIVKSKFRGK